MSNTIILHISDLHFSSSEDKKREKDIIMTSLINVLQQMEEEWKPNVVCVSGDIVDRCQVVECMKNSWLEEAMILGGLIDVLNKK